MLELRLNSGVIQIYLTSNGFIEKIVQKISGVDVIDDCWTKNPRYHRKEPYWLIDELRIAGWKLKSH